MPTKQPSRTPHRSQRGVGQELEDLEHRYQRQIRLMLEKVPARSLLVVLILGVISALVGGIAHWDMFDPNLNYRAGDVANGTIISPRTFRVADPIASQANRQQTKDLVLPIYDFDTESINRTIARLNKAFSVMRSSVDFADAVSRQKGRAIFEAEIRQPVSEAEYQVLAQAKFNEKLERQLESVLNEMQGRLIVADKEVVTKDLANKGLVVRHLSPVMLMGMPEETVRRSWDAVDLFEARDTIEDLSKKKFGERSVLALFARNLVVANVVKNEQETDRRRELVTADLPDVSFVVHRGEKIVGYKEKVSNRASLALAALAKEARAERPAIRAVFTAGLVFIILILLWGLRVFEFRKFRLDLRDFVAFGSIVVFGILAGKALVAFSWEFLPERFPAIPHQFYFLIMPWAAGTMLVRLVTRVEQATIFALVNSLIIGVVFQQDLLGTLVVLGTSLAGIMGLANCQRRSTLFKAGIRYALVGMLLVYFAYGLKDPVQAIHLKTELLLSMGAVLVSGIVGPGLVFALTPIVEGAFKYTSDLRLLELESMDHPLLKILMLKARGTFHHSLNMAAMVEIAAEKVGANSLLARVSCLYHDIGKTDRPKYFIENQGGGENPHDRLSPHMSALVIKDHVKKGLEIARQYGLPAPILDAIEQHHGTTLISFFMKKAVQNAKDTGINEHEVLEQDYRYDGPKPQTKECALVMLADTVEAATRSLSDPTGPRLVGTVQNILNRHFSDGQLSECDLTLRDLDVIAQSFIEVLGGMYHGRTEYHQPAHKDKDKDRDKEFGRGPLGRNEELKRLGIKD